MSFRPDACVLTTYPAGRAGCGAGCRSRCAQRWRFIRGSSHSSTSSSPAVWKQRNARPARSSQPVRSSRWRCSEGRTCKGRREIPANAANHHGGRIWGQQLSGAMQAAPSAPSAEIARRDPASAGHVPRKLSHGTAGRRCSRRAVGRVCLTQRGQSEPSTADSGFRHEAGPSKSLGKPRAAPGILGAARPGCADYGRGQTACRGDGSACRAWTPGRLAAGRPRTSQAYRTGASRVCAAVWWLGGHELHGVKVEDVVAQRHMRRTAGTVRHTAVTATACALAGHKTMADMRLAYTCWCFYRRAHTARQPICRGVLSHEHVMCRLRGRQQLSWRRRKAGPFRGKLPQRLAAVGLPGPLLPLWCALHSACWSLYPKSRHIWVLHGCG